MISIQNISYAYGKTEVLRDISFDVFESDCVAVLGNNGAGKSTLITCLNKIRTPKTGSLTIDGKNLLTMSRQASARLISYVAQINEVSRMTVLDCILLGRKPYIKWGLSKADITICEDMLDQIGLTELGMRFIDELSGGELQKVMIARALVQEPKLLLLDEPSVNLDLKNQHDMMALIQKMASEREIAVLAVLHDINLALRFCNKFLLIKSGSVYQYGDDSIINGKNINAVYGINSTLAEIDGRKIIVTE
jgi:iron complex transport system ATP-binding protein